HSLYLVQGSLLSLVQPATKKFHFFANAHQLKSNRDTILSALGQTGTRLMHQQHNSMFTWSLELILVHHHSMASNLMVQQLPLALAMTTITNSSNPNNNSLPLELLCLLVLAGTVTASLLLMLHKGMVLHRATVVQVELVKHLQGSKLQLQLLEANWVILINHLY
ncbi:uncharacterized protein LOC123396423, partial [Hordeum vulgare subsp. vulgare]|uniref:uncharacterized protein LOC123396423 n=1 Tax=Hordeum vulgare subsp. vulgare TaxID=112509 RepID=UPI001D1A5B43